MPKISQLFFRAAVVFLIFSIGAGLQTSVSGVHNVTCVYRKLDSAILVMKAAENRS
jgi:hypothetical protein